MVWDGGVFGGVVDVVYADVEGDEVLCGWGGDGGEAEGWVRVECVLGDLVDEGDGVVVVEGEAEVVMVRFILIGKYVVCVCVRDSKALVVEGWETYYSVDMSAPAKAKSHSCFLHDDGE